MIFGGKLADDKNLALLGLRLSPRLRRNMIGVPDVLMSKNAVRTQRTHQFGVGKENLSVSANANRSITGLPHEKLLPEPLEVPRIGLSRSLSPNSGKLLIVEGNIGVGKTTLTQKIARELNYKIFLEPATENPFLGKNHILN